MAAKIKKKDNVIVLAGSNKGMVGEVLKVFPRVSKAVVSQVNMVRCHVKAKNAAEGGSITSKEAPIHLSNLAIVDSVTGKPTRVGFRITDKGLKARYSKLSGNLIDD